MGGTSMRRVVIGLVLAGLLGAACGRASGPGQRSSPAQRSTTSVPPSAADDLADYFAAAEHVDQLLKAAATLVNGDVTGTAISVSAQTVDAIKAADPAPAAAAIPAGLSPELLQQVMLVQSDLESRNASLAGFQRVGTGTSVPLTDMDAQRAMSCLSNGAKGATSFGADLAHVRETARSSPPVTVASPDSRDAAEVAILLAFLGGLNLGCASCGGQRYTTLPTIVWYPARVPATVDDPQPADGTINGVQFRADYEPGTGWVAQIYAC